VGAKRRQYTREFKIGLACLMEESGRSKAQIARELGIRESLPNWLGIYAMRNEMEMLIDTANL
jgi:transposase-like protein